jgi:hypothetical protein
MLKMSRASGHNTKRSNFCVMEFKKERKKSTEQKICLELNHEEFDKRQLCVSKILIKLQTKKTKEIFVHNQMAKN